MKRKLKPKPRIMIRNHRKWVRGRRCEWTNYKWTGISRQLFLVLNNPKSTIRDLADFGFDNGIKFKFSFDGGNDDKNS